jgi:Flp pilus assembly protein TadD
MKKNTLGSAIQSFKKSVTLVPRNPGYNYHLGIAYMRAGDATNAKQALEASLRVEPHSSYAEDARKALASLKN